MFRRSIYDALRQKHARVKITDFKTNAETVQWYGEKYLITILLGAYMLVIWTFLSCTKAYAHDAQVKMVLVLHSYHRGLAWVDKIDNTIASFFRKSDLDIEIYTEYMDTKRIHNATYMKQLHDLYKHKFRNQKFDVIISVDNNAFNFLTEHRNEFFPRTPVVFCGVNNFRDSMLKGKDLYTGVVESIEVKGTIDIALRLHPKSRQIIIYGTDTLTYLANKEVVKQLIPLYKGSLDFRFIEGLNIKEVQDNVRKLPGNSIILLIASIKDENGKRLLFRRFAEMVDIVSHVPQYSLWNMILGHGILGGKLISGKAQGETAARMALRILHGEKVENIPILKQSPNRYAFDYRQMQRFGITLSDLPEGSFVINRPVSFYTNHKGIFWGGTASIVILTLGVIVLGFNIKLRKKTEQKLIKYQNHLEEIVEERTLELRNSEKKLSNLIENVPIGIAIFTSEAKGSLIKINSTLCKIFGYISKDDFLKTPFSLHFYREQEKESFLKLCEQGTVINYETKFRHKDGSVFWGSVSSIPQTTDTETTQFISIFQDITEMKVVSDKLRRSMEFSSRLLENSPIPIIVVNPDTSIKYINKTLENFTGFSSKELMGTKIPYPFWRQDKIDKIKKDIKEAMKKGVNYFKEPFQNKNGKHLWVEITSTPIFKDGKLDYYIANWIDITDRKKAEEKIQTSLKEKEVLLQEIHHRVKNNMQVISSLLKLQTSSAKDKQVTDALEDCQGRIQAMAFVHETLYGSGSLSVIDFKAYITKLAGTIFRAYSGSKGNIKLHIDTENIKLGIEHSAPMGLIFNELTSNSLKYAFPKNQHGKILVTLRAVEQNIIEFMYSDNGSGIPEDLDWQNTDTLGLQLVKLLAEDQLDGTVNLNRINGTKFTIKFRLKEN